MINAQVGDVVKVDLDIKLDDGTVVVSSRSCEPITFEIGAGEVIRGIDNAVIGMTEGESKTSRIPPENAFGRYSGKRLILMNRDDFPSRIEPRKGKFLWFRKVNGKKDVVQIAGLNDSHIILDTNHLLAGKEIILDIELLEVLSPDHPAPKAASVTNPKRSPPPNEKPRNGGRSSKTVGAQQGTQVFQHRLEGE